MGESLKYISDIFATATPFGVVAVALLIIMYLLIKFVRLYTKTIEVIGGNTIAMNNHSQTIRQIAEDQRTSRQEHLSLMQTVAASNEKLATAIATSTEVQRRVASSQDKITPLLIEAITLQKAQSKRK